MKLIIGCCFFFLLLSVLIPEETEALGRVKMNKAVKQGMKVVKKNVKLIKEALKLAAKQGYELSKVLYYAQCMIENAPPGANCPSYVLGVGFSATVAIDSAQFRVKAPCKQYLGSCTPSQFTKTDVEM